MILPLCLALVKVHLEQRLLLWVQKKTLTKWNKPSGGLRGGQGLQHTGYEERLRETFVQPREEEGQGGFYGGFQLPKGRIWRRWDQAPLRGAQCGKSRGSKHKVDKGNAIQIYVRAFSPCR